MGYYLPLIIPKVNLYFPQGTVTFGASDSQRGPDVPTASQRPMYSALNMYRASGGNPQCGVLAALAGPGWECRGMFEIQEAEMLHSSQDSSVVTPKPLPKTPKRAYSLKVSGLRNELTSCTREPSVSESKPQESRSRTNSLLSTRWNLHQFLWSYAARRRCSEEYIRGPISAILSRRYVNGSAVAAPIDTGLFAGFCSLDSKDASLICRRAQKTVARRSRRTYMCHSFEALLAREHVKCQTLWLCIAIALTCRSPRHPFLYEIHS